MSTRIYTLPIEQTRWQVPGGGTTVFDWEYDEGRDRLLGLYEGIPLTARGTSYTAAMPDRITIFKATVLRQAHTHADVVATVRKTVIHEIAHHFGISDPRLDELGWS